MNRKILDKGRAIVKDAGAPHFFWADAFCNSCLCNESDSQCQSGKPDTYETFFGKNLTSRKSGYGTVTPSYIDLRTGLGA